MVFIKVHQHPQKTIFIITVFDVFLNSIGSSINAQLGLMNIISKINNSLYIKLSLNFKIGI